MILFIPCLSRMTSEISHSTLLIARFRTRLLGARQTNVNASVVLPGTLRSATRMRLKFWHLYFKLSPIFMCRNFIPGKLWSSNIASCNFIYCSRPRSTSEAFTWSVFARRGRAFTSFCRACTRCLCFNDLREPVIQCELKKETQI